MKNLKDIILEHFEYSNFSILGHVENPNFSIYERLHINKDTGNHHYNYHPKTCKELKGLVNKLINERGNDADLNDIDTSKITDMSEVFYYSRFNGDISKWNVSNVKNMQKMFSWSNFNGDISNWDVSNVKNMYCMFRESSFTGENGDISSWNVSNVKNMGAMFYRSPLQKNPPKWYK